MRLVAVSHDLARHLAEGFQIPLAGLGVVHNGIPLPPRPDRSAHMETQRAARAAAGLPGDGRLVLAVGNLYPVKDHATLLRAVSRLPEDVHLAIAGRGGEEERLRGLARKLKLENRCHLLGVRDDVQRLLQSADVFAQPSLSEGLPLSVLEAMGAALPVVASRVGGIPEAVAEGQTGLLVDPKDPDGLANALGRILADPALSVSLGIAANSRAEAEFSVPAMVQGYRNLYHA
jgi:glycosyltransferase involved in cell wall biosynthesis